MCPNEEQGKERIYRIEEAWPPYALLAVGEAVPRIDRREADIAALRYAVALHRDQVLGPDAAYAGDDALRRVERFGARWRTGLKSLASWIACLEDSEHLGYHYWNANVRGFLIRNRSTAVRYLRAMQGRCVEAVASYLESAIEMYQAVIEEAELADTSQDAISSIPGRRALISRIERITDLERRAVAELDGAVKTFG
jgi:hypothetical protein